MRLLLLWDHHGFLGEQARPGGADCDRRTAVRQAVEKESGSLEKSVHLMLHGLKRPKYLGFGIGGADGGNYD